MPPASRLDGVQTCEPQRRGLKYSFFHVCSFKFSDLIKREEMKGRFGPIGLANLIATNFKHMENK